MIDDPASASATLRRSTAEGLGEEAILCLAMAFEVIARATRPRTQSAVGRAKRVSRPPPRCHLEIGYEARLDRTSWTWPKIGSTASMVTCSCELGRHTTIAACRLIRSKDRFPQRLLRRDHMSGVSSMTKVSL